MKSDKNKGVDRRRFLRTLGAGAVVTAAAGLESCNSQQGRSPLFGYQTGEVPTDKMTYRTQPRTGDRVSLLGYGCMRWPTRQRADGNGQEIDQEMVNQLVDYAIEHGVNYFDTSPLYVQALSEKATGIALSRHPREKWFIATKMSNHRAVPPGVSMRDYSIEMYHNSMEQLQVDYLDYYLLHGVGMGGGMKAFNDRFVDPGLIDFLLKEREAGRIRNLGWSFHQDVAVFDHLLSTGIDWDFAQIQLNYADWKNADGSFNVNAEYLYGELEKRNITATIMEPLLGGRLARLNPIALELLRAHRPGDNPAQWAFRYAGTHEKVLTVLSGMTYMEHLQDNIRTYSPLQPVTPDEEETLQKVAEIILKSQYISCTTCQYCMPCPYGLDIPSIFSHYNRCISDDNMPRLDTQEAVEYRRARRAFLVGYDRSVPRLRQASHCTNCGQCRSKCTQSINIPDEMVRIDEFVELLKKTV
ncbi:MAG: aldo/keto reductase [Tannerella sp.]|nr:aldo/keto reductase [Tannerella sp.]